MKLIHKHFKTVRPIANKVSDALLTNGLTNLKLLFPYVLCMFMYWFLEIIKLQLIYNQYYSPSFLKSIKSHHNLSVYSKVLDTTFWELFLGHNLYKLSFINMYRINLTFEY